MSGATLTCLGLAYLAVACAAIGLPRLAVAFVVGTVDLGLAGQMISQIDADPLVVLVSGTALLTVAGTVVGGD